MPSEIEILLAAASRCPAEFSEWDLTFHAWLLSPLRFGMRGYREKHPDHKRVYVALYGRAGVLRLKLIERTRPNHFRLTPAGRGAVQQLPAALFMGEAA